MIKLLLIIVLFLNSHFLVFANPIIQARTAILVDYHYGEILYEIEPDS